MDGRKPIPRRLRTLARLAIAAAAVSFVWSGVSRADTDTIVNTGNVPVVGNKVTCSSVTAPKPWTPSSFSFDISWVDQFDRLYMLADRSHGGPGGTAGGDVLLLDLNNQTPSGLAVLTPPANDPMAGIACDQNSAFGGTTGVGRNEITGPNGVFTVNHVEAWVGDGPSQFQPVQDPAGVGTPADYAADKCDSSVRVFNLFTHQQTDHINVHGCFRTDEGAFDPVDQIALFANPSEQPLPGNTNATALNNSPFITLISTLPVAPNSSHPIVAQINFDGMHGTVNANGGIEQAVYSRDTGLFYISIPGNSAAPNDGFVSVVDPRNPRHIHVVENYHLHNCSPNGAALGPDNELLVGCTVGPEQVIDIRTGHVLKAVTGTSGGCDEVWFNPGDDHFLGACTDSNSPSFDNLDITDADPIHFDQAINTKTPGAHSVAADPLTLTALVPAAAGGLCGTASPCILQFAPTGQDDKSEAAKEAQENHFHWPPFFGRH